MKRIQLGLLVAGVLLLAPTTWASVTLASLLAGGTLTSGDKTFSNFTCTVTDSGFTSGGCSGNVIAITDASGNPGFELQNFFSATGTASGGATEDVMLDYTVTATAPSLIHDVEMTFNATAPLPNSIANITETICPSSSTTLCGTPLAVISVSASNLGAGQVVKLSDSADLTSNQASVNVFKDIGLTSDSTGNVSFSILTQTFSETVPEPGTIALLGSALLGCAAIFRRRLRERA